MTNATLVQRRAPKPSRDVPTLALNKTESAQALGVSVDFFDEHIAHEIECVRRGRRRMYPVVALEQWLTKQAELAGPEW